jgi:UDP-3-O-acyl N-acetylglucosamine deacetylase
MGEPGLRRVTLDREVSLSGNTIRSKAGQSTITLRPGAAGFGFTRGDTGARYPADLGHVHKVPNCTALGDRKPAVYVVEHVLSALVGLGFTDAEIEVSCEEAPLLDGSAQPYVEALLAAGRRELDGEVEPLAPSEPVWHARERGGLVALPSDRLVIEYSLDHGHPRIGRQHVRLEAGFDYAAELAPARTFATDEEIRFLQRWRKIRGGSESNVLVVYPDHYSAELRLEREFARHKLVDLLGDLALTGRPIQAHLIAWRTGHHDNHELGRKLLAAGP